MSVNCIIFVLSFFLLFSFTSLMFEGLKGAGDWIFFSSQLIDSSLARQTYDGFCMRPTWINFSEYPPFRRHCESSFVQISHMAEMIYRKLSRYHCVCANIFSFPGFIGELLSIWDWNNTPKKTHFGCTN